jgi:hypothetical protein
MTAAKIEVSEFAKGAAQVYAKGRDLERTIAQVIESWAPIIRARMAAAEVESHADRALNPEGVKRVTMDLFVEFFNGSAQAMHDLRVMASHNCVGFEKLVDGDHLDRILKKVKGLNNVSPGVKYVYQTFNDLCVSLGYRQRDKNKAQKEREAAAAAAETKEPVSQETAKPGMVNVEVPENSIVLPVPVDMPLSEAIIALMQGVYGIEPGIDNINWIEMLDTVHDYIANSKAVEPELAAA